MNTHPPTPEETDIALRIFLRTHGVNTTILNLARVLRSLGPDWQQASTDIEAVTGHSPHDDDDHRQAMGAVTGRIFGHYPDTGIKIVTIKAVRLALGMGLKDAKDFTEQSTSEGVFGDLEMLTALNTEMKRQGLTNTFVLR